MRPKTLTNHELIDIKDIFLSKTRGKITKEVAQIWYETCLEFIGRKYKGSMLITEETRQAEERILQDETFCREYLAALRSTVGTDLVQLSDSQRAVLLLMATDDERQEAIKLIQS